MGRASVPCVYDDDVELEIGRAYVLREGSDVTIIACGVEIKEALAAADVLADRGVSAEVIDAFSVKPLDEETILASVEKTAASWSPRSIRSSEAWDLRSPSFRAEAPCALRLRRRARSLRQVGRVRGAHGVLRLGFRGRC